MNADIRISTTFFSHHKTKKLLRRLGPDGIVHLLKLWTYAAQYRPDGSLRGMDAEDIAVSVDWLGDPDEFVRSLCETGFVERDEDGTYRIHDWQEHNLWASEAEERSDKARLSRLRQVNKEGFDECLRRGIDRLSPSEYARWKAFRSVVAGRGPSSPSAIPPRTSGDSPAIASDRLATASAPLAPSPSPIQEERKTHTPPLPPSLKTPSDRPPAPPPESACARAPDYTIEFLQFWDAYPKQVGQDDAWRAWTAVCGRMDFPGLATLLHALHEQGEGDDWRRDGGRYIPLPAKWLTSGRWKDRPPRAAQRSVEEAIDEWAREADAADDAEPVRGAP
ncbi:hypothetical protein GGQ74_001165 [Desulfobaculum xiamenense]|uniref:Uncharacterized protein n=1 Tax=Desulfobaculum xiamenense TaxID=995050 RepID=A0A846QQ47_9BACT|nr:hypothetical protein [Desulfobaculum xiamenense]NJB67525.1 hypothetical protein [Desulfobaculum xiamenense]